MRMINGQWKTGVASNYLTLLLLKLITGPADNLILDMFAGSGTTPLECERAGVKWVAIEKEQASCEIIKNRIKTYLWGETEPNQERLFPMKQESLL